MTELEVKIWLEHLEWRNRGGEPDLSMDGLVPKETQERWKLKQMSQKYTAPEQVRKLIDAEQRAARAAADIAKMREESARKAEYERQKAEQANAARPSVGVSP